MIYAILQQLWTTILPILTVGSLLFFIGLYVIIQFIYQPQKSILVDGIQLTDEDQQTLAAIAGDDSVATQLDLARAFLEAGRQAEAEKILTYVANHGSLEQQKEAKSLIHRNSSGTFK